MHRSGFLLRREPPCFPGRWSRAVAASDARLQWDPNHDPLGRPLQRRALQLGLRGAMLRRLGEAEILSVQDTTPFVKDQAAQLVRGLEALMLPEERVYQPDLAAALAAGVDAADNRNG